MKQLAQNYRTGAMHVENVPPPALLPGGVLVQTRHSVVSAGTERASVGFARSNILQKARARPDLVRQVVDKVRTDGLASTYRSVRDRLDQWVPLGYSSAGEVLEVGPDTDGFERGQIVACAGGGFAAHAETVWVPSNLVTPVPDGVSTRDAAFATIGAVALHGIHRAGVKPGDRVAVIGLGLLGLLTIQILKAYGSPVLGLDVSADAVTRGLEFGMGAGAIIGTDDSPAAARKLTNGVGVDAAIITAASASSEPVELAGEVCRDGGTVCVVGDVGMDVSRRLFYEKELDLVVARSYGPGRYDPLYEIGGIDYPIAHSRWTVNRNMAEFLRLVAAGQVRVDPLVGRSYSIDDAPAAYEALLEGKAKGATVIEYPDSERPQRNRIEFPTSTARPKDSVGVGLIGAGSFVGATLLPALKDLPNTTMRGVVAATGLSATRAAQRGGFGYATTDYNEVIQDPNVDLVMIVTRHNLHAPLAVEALEAGKDVFVEKPLALSVEELRVVAHAARTSDKSLMVGFNRRFAPLVEEMRNHVSGRGPLLMTYRVNAGRLPADHWLRDPVEGGGRILGEVCHFVDLLGYLAGSPPRSIISLGGTTTTHAEDLLTVLVAYMDGSQGTIIYSGLGPDRLPKEYIEATGDGAAATLDNFRTLDIYEGTRHRRSQNRRQDKGHRRELELLMQAIHAGTPPPITLQELLYSSLATLQIPEALQREQPVAVDLGALS